MRYFNEQMHVWLKLLFRDVSSEGQHIFTEKGGDKRGEGFKCGYGEELETTE